MRIFVAGGSGVLGRPVVRDLVAAGHEVTATTRSPERARVLERLGARASLMDGLDVASVRDAVAQARPEVLINQQTSLAAPARDYATWLATTNRLRSTGARILMAAARDVGTRRVIAQSASFMTHPDAIGPTDESSPLYVDAPEPVRSHVLANIATEHAALMTPGIQGVVLRYGFLYGEGTGFGPGGAFAEAVRSGDLPIVGHGAGAYPFVHLDDAVTATLAAVELGAGVYNVVDDEPARQGAWLPHLAHLLGAPAPARVDGAAAERLGAQAVYYGTQLRPATNARAKAELGLTLAYPSWKDGFVHVFGRPAGERAADDVP